MILCICPIGTCSSVSIIEYYNFTPSEIRYVTFSNRDSVTLLECSSYLDKYSKNPPYRAWSNVPMSSFKFNQNNYASWMDYKERQKRHEIQIRALYDFLNGIDGVIYCIAANEISFAHPDKLIEKFAWENKIPSLSIVVPPITRISENYPTEFKTEACCRFTYEEGRREWDLESKNTNLFEFKELQFCTDYFELCVKYNNLGCIKSDILKIRALNLAWVFKNIPEKLLDETNIIIHFSWRRGSNWGIIYESPQYPIKYPELVKTLREMIEYVKANNQFWNIAKTRDILSFTNISTFFPISENKGCNLLWRRW